MTAVPHTQDQQRVAALHDARAAARADWLDPGRMHRLLALSATPAFYAQITVLSRGFRGPWLLCEAADSLMLAAGMPVPEVLGWLAVIAGSPAADPVAEVMVLIEPTVPRPMAGRFSDGPSPMDRWRAAVPAEMAPLAWAAGLTLEEAATLHAAGTLEAGVLRGLAALRGYRLSSVPGETIEA